MSLSGTLALTQQLTELHTSQPKPQQQAGSLSWLEDGMEVANTSTAVVPHYSNIGIVEVPSQV